MWFKIEIQKITSQLMGGHEKKIAFDENPDGSE
jgi:hypothetical protein